MTPAVIDRLLTTAEAAELLGVGLSSVKRWADDGTLPCVRTPGGHRRFWRSAVEALRDRTPPVEPAPDWHGALLGPAEEAVLRLVVAERQRAGSWAVAGETIAEVLAELGRRWARGDITVVQEHIASERVSRALTRCAEAVAPPPGAPVAVLASAEGEEHTLGLAIAELVLRERGLATRWVGRATPVRFLCDHVEAGGVAVVVVSASACSADAGLLADQAQRLGEACRRAGARLLLGGRGAWPDPPPFGERLFSFAGLAAAVR